MPDLPAIPPALQSVLVVAVGLLLLLFGRRLFWLAVGVAGFAAGLLAARRWLALDPPWLDIAIAVACGVAGALLAVLLQRLMVALAGFVAGAWLVLKVGTLAGAPPEGFFWLLFALLGGVAGGVLAGLLFGFALAAVTALAGASLLVDAAGVTAPADLVLLAVLTVAGTVIQIAFGRTKRRKDD